MSPHLTSDQMVVLRRCVGGLRLWETGKQRVALLATLDVLCRLRLVQFDESNGYEATPQGETWLVKFDR